jgi:ADP-ribosylglycohydrolase
LGQYIPTIIGAIAGDIIGAPYEWNRIKTTEFPLFSAESDFTDDTVLTIAVADSILSGKDFAATLRDYGRRYPNRGYGGFFRHWLHSDNPRPYGSFGNGSAMRASPTGFAASTLEEAVQLAQHSAEVTHNHPEGIKGAQATAAAIYLARTGCTKQQIRDYVTRAFGYDLDFTLDEIRPTYRFNETCQQTVPQAIVAFLESTDYESAIRLAISLGGDSDTLACITGGIAAAYYKEIPEAIVQNTLSLLPEEFREVIRRFDEKYATPPAAG